MATGEVTKGRSGSLLDSARASSWQTRIALVVTALLLVLLLVQAVRDPAQFFSQLVIGVTNGAIIALIALGYTLVYGIIELINFAHGDNFMIGSFVGLTVLSGTFVGLGFFGAITGDSGTFLKVIGVLVALVVAMAVCGSLNVAIERVAYKPLRNSPRLAVLITAIGMSFILQNLGLIWKGPAQVPFPELVSSANILPTDAIVFRWKDLFVLGMTVPLLLGFSYFISNTRQGKAMRAVAQDKEAASMVGINVNRTISITFLLGGILAGASGVMFGLFNGITVFNVGFFQGLYAFTAAVLGGIGNLTGAVVGGFLIGIIGSMADQYIGVEWTSIVIFSVLILVLVFRPRGLLGDRSAVQGEGLSVTLLRKYALPVALIGAALLFPLWNSFLDGAFDVNLMYPVIVITIYIMLALGLNIVVGFAGLLDLGFVAFYALGAYVVAWLASGHFRQVSVTFGTTATSITGEAVPGIHLSFWLVLLIAGAFTALCGVIIGAPTLRLRGDYLAIVTLGFGEIIPRFFQNGDDLGGFNLTNGTIGIKAIDSPGFPFLPDSLGAWQRFGTLELYPWFYTILVMVLVTVYVNVRLQDSRLGRAWISVREDETAAAAMGINPVTTKLWAYALGATFGGFAGAFYGAFIKNVFPTSFSFNVSIFILLMVVLGGMGNIYGVILGAIVLQGTNFFLLPQMKTWVNAIGEAIGNQALATVDIPKYSFFIFGVLLVVMMLFRPEGIIPNRQRAEELHDENPGSGDAMGGRLVPENANPNGSAANGVEDGGARTIMEARGITKVFGGLVAVNRVDFDIPEISIVSLIGPNGAGKTTFFNMVSGLYEPSAGSFMFAGRDVTRLGAHQRAQMGIGRTFQNIRLFGTMSARDNVLSGMHTRLKGGILGSILRTPGTRREEREAREMAGDLLDYVGIRRREVFAKNLSYGDQRRLEIARALASEPKLLLLDEPTAGMNPQETARLTELIRRLREERGISILLIEHEMRVVMSISDRVTVLDHGEKISEGSPREVREDPRVIEAYLGTAKTG